MKRHLTLSLMAAVLIAAASSVSAWWGNWGGYGWNPYDPWDPRFWLEEFFGGGYRGGPWGYGGPWGGYGYPYHGHPYWGGYGYPVYTAGYWPRYGGWSYGPPLAAAPSSAESE